MKVNFYFHMLKWMAACLSCMTMIFSPLALGKEAEKINKVALEKYIVEFGLDKQMTLGEFWEKSKSYIPGYAYSELENFIKQNKNMMMPEVMLDQSRSTDGNEVPVIKLSLNGRTQTLQFFGESKKWARYNGVTLSAADLERPQDAFARIEASDIKLKKEADQFRKNQLQKLIMSQQKSPEAETLETYKKDFGRFAGFPRMTPQLWQSLTKVERAGFIVKMRLLWTNARKVLDLTENTGVSAPTSPTAPSQKKPQDESSIKNFYKIIFGQDASAAEALVADAAVIPSVVVQVQGTSVRTNENGVTRVVSVPYTAKSCVVAGYIGAYVADVKNVSGEHRAGCSADVAIAAYKTNASLDFVQKANDACKASNTNDFVACNPIIYGYPQGKEACISKVSVEYQYATHFTNPAPNPKETCDGKSRLSSSEDIIKFSDKDYSNLQPRSKQLEAIEADQKKEDYQLTKDFLNGVLAKKGTSLDKIMAGKWDVDTDNELVRIQSQFEEEIQRAIATCEKSVVEGVNEKNQKLACDQLHRRWLFTERSIASYRDKACMKPALYIGLYDKDEASYADSAKNKTALNKKTITAQGAGLCACPAGDQSKADKVSFGEGCAKDAVVPPVVEPGKCGDNTNPVKTGDDVACVCKLDPKTSGKPGEAVNCEPAKVKCDKPEGISDFDYDKCECKDGKSLKQDDGKYECEGKNWLPWVLGAGALALLFAIFQRHKNPKNPPPVIVPGQCPTGRSGTPPACVCSNVCPAGQMINPDSCSCSVIINPPSCAAPKVGNPPSCVCPAAPSFCTPPQKIYDMNTCQCTDVPQAPVCPNGQPALNGNLSLCPKCPSGIFEPAGGCPNEGGGGNNCPQGGCSGGLPGTGH